MYYYAFTLRKTSFPVFITDYDNHLKSFKDKYLHIELEYHFEDTSGLHIHGMLRTPKKVHVRQLHPGQGWNLDFGFVKSKEAWSAYMTKDNTKQTNLINEQYELVRYYDEFVESTREYPSDDSDTEQVRKILRTKRIV